MKLSIKIYLLLLWGMFVLISIETKSVSIPETSSSSLSAEPNQATRQTNTPHNPHYETQTQHLISDPTHKPADFSTVESAVSPTTERRVANVSSKSDTSDASVAATTSSSSPRLTHIFTTVGEAQHSQDRMMSETEKPTDHPNSPTTSTKMTAPAKAVTLSAASSTTAAAAVSLLQPASSAEPAVTSSLSSSDNFTQAPHVIQNHNRTSNLSTTTMTTNLSSKAALVFDPTSLSVAVTERATTSTEVSSTFRPISDTRTHISISHVPDTTGLSSTTESPTTAEFSDTSSSSSMENAAHFLQNVSSPSTSTTMTMSVNNTSKAAPAFDPTSLPVTVTERATTSTEVLSTFKPISDTRTHISTSHPDTTGLSSTTESPTTAEFANSTTTLFTSLAGIIIPRDPKRLPLSTTKSTTTNSPSTPEAQPCSTRGVVRNCLIIIASLAGLATIFMVSTIILCTKLSGKKYKLRRPQQGTEMMCISSLLPERNHNYTRQRNPISNGVLVIPVGEDSDDDGGDNLTLSSFLPENDRVV